MHGQLVTLPPLAAQGPDLALAQVPNEEPLPAAPAAPSPALEAQQEQAPGSSPPPAADLDLLVAPPQEAPLEMYLQAALDPLLPFASLPDILMVIFLLTLAFRDVR